MAGMARAEERKRAAHEKCAELRERTTAAGVASLRQAAGMFVAGFMIGRLARRH